MSLVRTSLLNGIVVVTRVLTALVINKVLAVFVGPSGYAIIGQFQNAISVIVSLAGVGLGAGVTKSTAAHFDDELRQKAIWRTAMILALASSICVGVALVMFRGLLADALLHDRDMAGVFVWLAMGLPAIAANNLLLAMTNGKKDVAVFVIANVVGSLLILVLAGALTYYFNLFGALVAFAVSPAVTLLATALLLRRRKWLRFRDLWGALDRGALRELSGFALMGLTSALSMPTALILIREMLSTSLGLTQAGYWQASWRLSEVYLMLITTTLAVYFLPRIAEIRKTRALKSEILKVFRLAIPVVIVTSILIFLARDLIIEVLFTTAFSPMRDLFGWQLLGDSIKISGWILGYVMLGRAMVRSYVITEVLFSALFFGLAHVFVNWFGLQGVGMAFLVNSLLYLGVTAVLIRGELQRMQIRENQIINDNGASTSPIHS